MPEGDSERDFWEHVVSLRNHVLLSLGFFITVVILIFAYWSDKIISYLLAPLHGIPLVFLTPLGPFLFKFQISLNAGLVISLPVWLAASLHFLSPVLSLRQKAAAALFIAASFATGIAAVLAAYYLIVPYTLDFLLSIVVPGTSFFLTTDSYMAFFLLQIIMAFVLLQIPLITVTLSYLGILDPGKLSKHRRFIYPALLFVLAVITPTTDALTLLLAFLPSVLLTELGFAMAKVVYNNRGISSIR